MRVAAIVVSWNSADDLPACLAALDSQDYEQFEVVVVDNASEDASLHVLETWERAPRRHDFRFTRNTHNRGFCGGVNDALGLLDDDVQAVLLVNPDVTASEQLTSRCVRALAVDPSRGSIQPRLHRAVPGRDGSVVIDTTGHVLTRARTVLNRGEGEPADAGTYLDPDEIFGASGACVLHRRSMLEDIAWDASGHVLTEDLIAYFDDVDLDWRARRRGWSAWYEPSAVAVHERGGAGPRRTSWVCSLNWSNQLLVSVTCDRVVGRDLAAYGFVGALRTIELALTRPRALLVGIGRLRSLPAAMARRRHLMAVERVAVADVVARWARPMPWRIWVTRWWARRSGRGSQPSSS